MGSFKPKFISPQYRLLSALAIIQVTATWSNIARGSTTKTSMH
jgi:hypothetical protein